MSVTIEKLREIRKSLPVGKKDPWGECCKSKRILLQRALKKRKSLIELTAGERAAVQEFIAHCQAVRKEDEQLANQVEQLTAEL